jgi:hypothetical protein
MPLLSSKTNQETPWLLLNQTLNSNNIILKLW